MDANLYRVSTPRTSRQVNTGEVVLTTNHFHGNGPEILLIHGIGSGSATWDPVIDLLAKHASPVTVDLRGHGLSSKPERDYVYDDYVRDIDSLIRILELDSPIIVGHSLGGVMTLAWAMRHPTSARALIIEDSPVVSSFRFRPAFDWWIILNSLPYEMVHAFYAREHPEWPPYLVQKRARLMKVTNRAVFSEMRSITFRPTHLDHDGSMRAITAPSLYIYGDPGNGSLIPTDHVMDLPKHLPEVELLNITGGTHTMHRSHPDQFVDAVLRFLIAHRIIPMHQGKEL